LASLSEAQWSFNCPTGPHKFKLRDLRFSKTFEVNLSQPLNGQPGAKRRAIPPDKTAKHRKHTKTQFVCAKTETELLASSQQTGKLLKCNQTAGRGKCFAFQIAF